MLFSTINYIFIFLPLIFLFFLISKKFSNLSVIYLLFSSLFFYAFWDFKLLFLLLFSIIFNFYISRLMIGNSNLKNLLLYFGIGVNVFILIIFKYLNFIIENFNLLFDYNIGLIYLTFPLALSFYTIQQVAYLFDCYDEEIKDVKFTNYALFISFFPQLISGPIVLYRNVSEQIANLSKAEIDYKNVFLGILIFTIGLSKKVLIADSFEPSVQEGFASATTINYDFIESWLISILFTFQIYFDFSGYTDMAIGSALILNIILPINFLSPYKSTSIISFWQKWHITLSNFINQYCFNKIIYKYKLIGPINSKIIIIIIMTIAGFWHGPTWGYIIFGLIHGLAISVNYFWKETNIILNKFLGWFLTFLVICFAFVFFKSSSLEVALNISKGMLGFNGIDLPIIFKTILPNFLSNSLSFAELDLRSFNIKILIIFVISLIIVFCFKNTQSLYQNYKYKIWHIWLYSFLFFISILRLRGVEFVYFAF